MKVCNNCKTEYPEDMNYCELCGEKLEVIATEDPWSAESPKEEHIEEKQTISNEGDELDRFVDEMCSIENREILKELIAGAGAEWFGKDKEFLREVMVRFAEFKAKKNNPPQY